MAKMVLDLWADVANITFVPAIDQSGQIRFFNSDELPLPGQAYFPGKDHGGDVHVNPKAVENSDTSFGGGALLTLLHEVGHALGLRHPGNYDADPENPASVLSYEQYAEYLEDSMTIHGHVLFRGDIDRRPALCERVHPAAARHLRDPGDLRPQPVDAGG